MCHVCHSKSLCFGWIVNATISLTLHLDLSHDTAARWFCWVTEPGKRIQTPTFLFKLTWLFASMALSIYLNLILSFSPLCNAPCKEKNEICCLKFRQKYLWKQSGLWQKAIGRSFCSMLRTVFQGFSSSALFSLFHAIWVYQGESRQLQKQVFMLCALKWIYFNAFF